MHDILDMLTKHNALPEQIRVTDIGAMSLGRKERWQRLVDQGVATVLGFEPQAEEWARCHAEKSPGCHYLQEAIGDGRKWPFHQCNFAPTSSMLEPNIDFVSQFYGLADLMQVVATSEVQTRSLDDIEEARQTDFLKLDVQGAELAILENATETLKHVSIVQTEVSFVPLYKEQPLFADIDHFLRARGFMFHTFLGFGRRAIRPLMVNNDPNAAINQMLWSDAVYIKPFGALLKGAKPSVLLKRAVLFHELFQSYDFVTRALQDYDRLTGNRLAEIYVAGLSDRHAA